MASKLLSQNHQKPESTALTASTAFQMVQAASANRSTGLFENLIFLQALYKVAIQRNFFKMDYGKGAIEGIGDDTKRVVAQFVESCDDALEIVPVKGGASSMCLHFHCQCGQVMDESNEVVQVLTQSTWDNRNRFNVVNCCRNLA